MQGLNYNRYKEPLHPEESVGGLEGTLDYIPGFSKESEEISPERLLAYHKLLMSQFDLSPKQAGMVLKELGGQGVVDLFQGVDADTVSEERALWRGKLGLE